MNSFKTILVISALLVAVLSGAEGASSYVFGAGRTTKNETLVFQVTEGSVTPVSASIFPNYVPKNIVENELEFLYPYSFGVGNRFVSVVFPGHEARQGTLQVNSFDGSVWTTKPYQHPLASNNDFFLFGLPDATDPNLVTLVSPMTWAAPNTQFSAFDLGSSTINSTYYWGGEYYMFSPLGYNAHTDQLIWNFSNDNIYAGLRNPKIIKPCGSGPVFKCNGLAVVADPGSTTTYFLRSVYGSSTIDLLSFDGDSFSHPLVSIPADTLYFSSDDEHVPPVQLAYLADVNVVLAFGRSSAHATTYDVVSFDLNDNSYSVKPTHLTELDNLVSIVV